MLEAADGIHRIANARMTRALRSVSSEKGRDPRDFAIIAYGGSGPVHAGGLADELGVTTVLVPPVAGLFSAVGLLFARPEFHEVRSCHLDVDAVDPPAIAALLDEMEAVLTRAFAGRDEPAWAAHRRPPLRRPELGDRGRAADGPGRPGAARRRCGRASRTSTRCSTACAASPGSPVEVRAVRLAALGASAAPPSFDVADALVRDRHATPADVARRRRRRRCRCGRAPRSAPTPEPGPLLVDEYDTTVVVPGGLERATASRDRRRSCSSRRRPMAELRERAGRTRPTR